MNFLLNDNIAGIRQIKSYSAESDEHANFNRLSDGVRKATLNLMKWWAVYNPSMSFASMLGYVLVLGVGGVAMIDGDLTRGEFLKFFLLLSLFYDPVSRLRQLNQMVLSSRAAGDRVFEILDYRNEENADHGNKLPEQINAEIRFDKVSFSYDQQPTLHEVSLHALPGQTVALVGSTGAGKSTVLSLLNRFYEYNDGTITVDDQDIGQLAKPSLREKLAYVTQEPIPVQRIGARESSARQTRCDGGRNLGRSGCRPCRSFRPEVAQAARHPRGRTRSQTFRRGETTAVHRPRPAQERPDPAPG